MHMSMLVVLLLLLSCVVLFVFYLSGIVVLVQHMRPKTTHTHDDDDVWRVVCLIPIKEASENRQNPHACTHETRKGDGEKAQEQTQTHTCVDMYGGARVCACLCVCVCECLFWVRRILFTDFVRVCIALHSRCCRLINTITQTHTHTHTTK